MNCEQFQTELERAIDERQMSDRAALVGHAGSCESCRSSWQDFVLLETALVSWSQPVEVNLVERVAEAARQDEQLIRSAGKTTSPETSPGPVRSTASPRRRSWLMAATVAVLILGVAIAFRSDPNQTADSDPQPIPPPDRNGTVRPELNEEEQYAGVDELLAETRSAWQGIASKAVDRAGGLSVFMPNLSSDLGLPVSSKPETEEPAPEVNVEEPTLLPGRINRAFDFLLNVSSDVTTT